MGVKIQNFPQLIQLMAKQGNISFNIFGRTNLYFRTLCAICSMKIYENGFTQEPPAIMTQMRFSSKKLKQLHIRGHLPLKKVSNAQNFQTSSPRK